MAEEVDPIGQWRQGDVCLDIGDIPVLAEEDAIFPHESCGAVVISQCCDIAKETRPYVQVAALVRVDQQHMTPIKLFREPRLALIPALEDECIVADLDVVATVAKRVVSRWVRTEGCASSEERRAFSYAVGRHKNRVGFPDPWAPALSKLRKWVKQKGAKLGGVDGQFINAVDQMRIIAEHVDSPTEVEIICILRPGWTDDQRKLWAETMIPKMSAMIDADWCSDVSIRLMDAEEISLAEYMEGYRLDFGALTER